MRITLLAFLCSASLSLAAGSTFIKNGVLQSDLDGGAFALTNNVRVTINGESTMALLLQPRQVLRRQRAAPITTRLQMIFGLTMVQPGQFLQEEYRMVIRVI